MKGIVFVVAAPDMSCARASEMIDHHTFCPLTPSASPEMHLTCPPPSLTGTFHTRYVVSDAHQGIILRILRGLVRPTRWRRKNHTPSESKQSVATPQGRYPQQHITQGQTLETPWVCFLEFQIPAKTNPYVYVPDEG